MSDFWFLISDYSTTGTPPRWEDGTVRSSPGGNFTFKRCFYESAPHLNSYFRSYFKCKKYTRMIKKRTYFSTRQCNFHENILTNKEEMTSFILKYRLNVHDATAHVHLYIVYCFHGLLLILKAGYLFIYLFIYPSIYSSICLFIGLFCYWFLYLLLSRPLYLYMYVHCTCTCTVHRLAGPAVLLAINLKFYLLFIYFFYLFILFIYLFIYLSFYLFIYLFVSLFVFVTASLPVRMYTCIHRLLFFYG